MTLQGISWFAVAIIATLNVLYAHFRYIPRVEKFDQKNLDPSNRLVGLAFLFLYSVALAIAVWNILLIPQVTYYWVMFGIGFPFFALPRLVTWAFKGGQDKLFDYESDRIIFEILSTTIIMSIVTGKI